MGGRAGRSVERLGVGWGSGATIAAAMGQSIVVNEKPSSNPGVIRFETNRALTGMDHERYLAGQEIWGERPPDELARRLFDKPSVAGVQINGNMITVDLNKGFDSEGLLEVIENLYRFYPDTPPVEGDSAEDVTLADEDTAPEAQADPEPAAPVEEPATAEEAPAEEAPAESAAEEPPAEEAPAEEPPAEAAAEAPAAEAPAEDAPVEEAPAEPAAEEAPAEAAAEAAPAEPEAPAADADTDAAPEA